MAQRVQMCSWALNGLVENATLPHIFLTTSEAELHNPFLHKLLDKVLPSHQAVASGECGAYQGQVCQYLGLQPPPADELRRRKLAVRDNLHLVTDFYVQQVRLLHHSLLQPLLDVESFVARHEFAQRRSMTHTHELLRIRDRGTDHAPQADAPALDPSTRPQVPTMQMCLDAVMDHSGDAARRIVAFVSWLGMSAIHPGERSSWPEQYGGRQPDATAAAAGNVALRRKFTSLSSAAERLEDEVTLTNRVQCHACGSYCLKPVVSRRTGLVLQDESGQPKVACRFRPDEKEKHSCSCPQCSADFFARLEYIEGACVACDEACGCGDNDCGCKTFVWQLPHTFRFELRYTRNLARLQ
eukprot:4119605-Prymnesium_polylepis.1